MLWEYLEAQISRSVDEANNCAAETVIDAFLLPNGEPNVLRCAELLVDGRAVAERLLRRALRRYGGADVETSQVASRVADEISRWQLWLTGAEAIAVLLAATHGRNVFAYPGTSELALCDAVDRLEGLRLVNGRGDKECAFMAAGASLLEPNRGVAILHGARGATNAAGGVADARRNEAGTLFIVGLPSSDSARFLPPHGEPDLLSGMGAFADWSWQTPAVPNNPAGQRQAAKRFVGQFRQALAAAADPPNRPALFGIPQDVAEKRWVAIDELAVPATDPATDPAADRAADRVAIDVDESGVELALRTLRAAGRALFLVDDYALRYPGVRQALDQVSRAVGGPVLQVRYRRGPMLFERLREDEVANFVGWLNQFSSAHTDLLDACDLLVTVEDRNIYERVVGRLPTCRKVAINSDPTKVLKNEYLEADDQLIVGNPARILTELAERLTETNGARPAPWFSAEVRAAGHVTPEPASTHVEHGRRAVAGALADVLAGWNRPVLIDDSQMFGGLLSEHYDDFPPGLRVFGGHGGFVGGGLASAVGLAVAHDDLRVMCVLGDQAFTNSFQGLVAAIQQRARVLFVVCNNGESVSLNKQGAATGGASTRRYLSNVRGFEYHVVAKAFGVHAEQVAVPIGGTPREVDAAVSRLSAVLENAASVHGPSLVELVVPSDPDAWRGIWVTQGFEERVEVTTR